MPDPAHQNNAHVAVGMAKLLGICAVTTLGMLIIAHKTPSPFSTIPGTKRTYTYVGEDYPTHWPFEPLDNVHLSQENTVHYAFNTELGEAEWNATLPSGGSLLHLGPTYRPFTLGMFHEIRCLNIIRKTLADYYADESEDAQIRSPQLAHHCMNFIRQMVLCRANLRLEPVRAAKGNHVTAWEVTHTCQDWTAVYSAAERNYQDYLTHI
ncbi:hypothetical protein D9756_004516 [Leucocoprinus leucothites]|uniref:Oxidase ustYa n=1 Tax=Leucocoprinus leucothites TaxID=201217 RepID=A0A8H5LKU4_9AGAR|nr:hypothetical protein D9756_004516 [Leucoagaricus leucothites]